MIYLTRKEDTITRIINESKQSILSITDISHMFRKTRSLHGRVSYNILIHTVHDVDGHKLTIEYSTYEDTPRMNVGIDESIIVIPIHSNLSAISKIYTDAISDSSDELHVSIINHYKKTLIHRISDPWYTEYKLLVRELTKFFDITERKQGT